MKLNRCFAENTMLWFDALFVTYISDLSKMNYINNVKITRRLGRDFF